MQIPGTWETGLYFSRCGSKGEPVIPIFSLYSYFQSVFTSRASAKEDVKSNWSNQQNDRATEQ